MSNFKAGDLALIVDAACKENIGRCVSLVQRHTSDYALIRGIHFGAYKGSPAWHVECDGMVSMLYGSIGFGFVSESCLIPLKGDFAPVKEKQEEQPA